MSEETNVTQEQADDGVIRIDLRNFNKEAESESVKDELRVHPDEEVQSLQQPDEVEPSEDVQESVQNDEEPHEEIRVLEEISDEDLEEQPAAEVPQVEEPAAEVKEEPKVELPEGIQKLVEFMDETGGSLEDYVRLNQDVSSLDELQLLKEYYARTKPHLDNEEIDFLVSDNFMWDDDVDNEREVKRKKLAYKEEL